MNLLSLIGLRLNNICQIKRKWYYSSGWNFFNLNEAPMCIVCVSICKTVTLFWHVEYLPLMTIQQSTGVGTWYAFIYETTRTKGLFGRAPAGSGFTCENTVHGTVAAREREPEEPEKGASPAPVNSRACKWEREMRREKTGSGEQWSTVIRAVVSGEPEPAGALPKRL
jgi:hypothetical protein